MIDRILGRTDDMVKVKGVNIYPSQIDTLLSGIEGASSEYQMHIEHVNGKDRVTLKAECCPGCDCAKLEEELSRQFKNRIGISVRIDLVELGGLPRSEKKTVRIYDYREN